MTTDTDTASAPAVKAPPPSDDPLMQVLGSTQTHGSALPQDDDAD